MILMNKIPQFLVILSLAALPCLAHAQVFQDSFESDSPGYNSPSTSSVPAWNDTTGTNPLVSLNNTSGGGAIPGEDGDQYLSLDFNSNGSLETNAIATVNGTTNDAPGVFAADTTYTLAALMHNSYAGSGATNYDFSGGFQLVDGTTGAVLLSVFHDFTPVAGNADQNFNEYSFTFDTATDPSLAGDYIQINLDASSLNGNGSVDFDKVLLTADTDTPEPTTFALLGVGALILVIQSRRLRLQRGA
jgi:hypothetical protein